MIKFIDIVSKKKLKILIQPIGWLKEIIIERKDTARMINEILIKSSILNFLNISIRPIEMKHVTNRDALTISEIFEILILFISSHTVL